MPEQHEKTNTKTLEVSNIDEKGLDPENDSNAEESRNVSDVTDPSMAANREAAKQDELTTRFLLKSQESDAKGDSSSNDGIEFSATTAVFQLTDEMKQSLLSDDDKPTEDKEKQAPANSASKTENTDELKLKLKKHYIKKARVLEAEVHKILSTFKTQNPAVQNKLNKIKSLLAQNSGRVKKH